MASVLVQHRVDARPGSHRVVLSDDGPDDPPTLTIPLTIEP